MDIVFVPVLEKYNNEWTGRLIARKRNGKQEGHYKWIGISHPKANSRITGAPEEIERILRGRINKLHSKLTKDETSLKS